MQNKAKLKIAIIGTGAIGGYYGILLNQIGQSECPKSMPTKMQKTCL